MQIRVEGWLGRRERRRKKKKKRCHRAPAVKIQTPVIYIVSGTKPGNEWRRVRTASAKTRVIDRRGGGLSRRSMIVPNGTSDFLVESV